MFRSQKSNQPVFLVKLMFRMRDGSSIRYETYNIEQRRVNSGLLNDPYVNFPIALESVLTFKLSTLTFFGDRTD